MIIYDRWLNKRTDDGHGLILVPSLKCYHCHQYEQQVIPSGLPATGATGIHGPSW